MTAIGYALSSEEHRPDKLVHHAVLAERAGFDHALISDHFHPWIDRQGESPFVWSVLGGIATATERMTIGTGVTCPILRVHPAIIAQAAATTAAMMPGRFFLGLGTGEALNEHVLGQRWPEWEVRAEMLEEAIGIIRALWTGDLVSHHGRHFTVENARLYTLPEDPPPIYIAAGGDRMASVAGRIGDGLIGTSPSREIVGAFQAGQPTAPRYGQVAVSWAESEAKARRVALDWWPTAAIRGDASQELPNPKDFEALAAMVDERAIAEAITCTSEATPILERIAAYVDAGYDHVYLHQVGPDQAGFIAFAESRILPELRPGVRSGNQRPRRQPTGRRGAPERQG